MLGAFNKTIHKEKHIKFALFVLARATFTFLDEKRLHQGHPLIVTMLNTNVITRVP